MKRKTGGKLLSVLLTLAMLAALLPGVSLTARAAEPAICTVTFDSDGGSAVAAQTVETGGKAAKPADPTLEGYRFLGWFVNPTQQTLFAEDYTRYNTFDFDQPVTDDVTLKAVWIAALRVEKSGDGRIDYATFGQEPKLDAPNSFMHIILYKGIYDKITVAAKADSGSRFVKWQKAVGEDQYVDYNTDAQFTLTVTEDLKLVALFETAYYSISGSVTMEDSTNVAEATVTLRGSDVVYNLSNEIKTTTDENGSYTFHNIVPCGRYNLTVTGNGRSKTEYVEVEDGDQTVNVVLPSYPVSSKVEVKEGMPAAVVIGLDKVAADSLTDEEKANNVAATVAMTIENAVDLTEETEETDLTAEQEAIKAEQRKIMDANTGVNAAQNLEFFNLSLAKTTASGSSDIHETQRVLEILLPYDTELRVFRIYRCHENQPETFTRLASRPTDTNSLTDATFYVGDGFITLYTDRFSTYAIGYTLGNAVIFNANGGTGTMVDQAVQGTATLNANAFTRGGYAFTGWNEKADGSGKSFADGAAITTNQDLTLYAQWRIIPAQPVVTPAYSSDDSSDDYINRVVKQDNGTVSVNRDTASRGEKVTITAKPNEGYEVDTVTVGGSGGRSANVTKADDGTYTYIQPGMDVTVNVTFRATGGAAEADCPQDSSCPLSAFTDADARAWYHDGVHWALEKGVMNGVGGDQFDPNGEISRAMAVTMLWRLEGSPAYAGASEFADVKNADWYGPAVRWANAEGIVTGYEQEGSKVFNPSGAVKREQLAAMLYRYAQHKGQGFTGLWAFPLNYPDAESVSDWAYVAMCWLTMNGVINGMDGALAPAAGASRAQVATMLMRYCETR
ncbi:MAG: InlB B-repeat-containing protein [Oscillospiraceae bacterium]|nr:InlB B-repeat-containing protein [Oscillospiraceae bacterium]